MIGDVLLACDVYHTDFAVFGTDEDESTIESEELQRWVFEVHRAEADLLWDHHNVPAKRVLTPARSRVSNTMIYVLL